MALWQGSLTPQLAENEHHSIENVFFFSLADAYTLPKGKAATEDAYFPF